MNENEKFWIKESNKLKWFKKPTTAILKKKKNKKYLVFRWSF